MSENLIAFGDSADEPMRVDLTVTCKSKLAHEWEHEWQITGEFCNIMERIHMLVRIQLKKIDSGQAVVCLAIWSGIVTIILSPTLRLKFAFDILNCCTCDSNYYKCTC